MKLKNLIGCVTAYARIVRNYFLLGNSFQIESRDYAACLRNKITRRTGYTVHFG